MRNLFIILFILNIGCMTVNKQSFMKVEKIIVSFHGFFENDTISVKLNNCLILKDKLLKSDDIIGYTGVTLTVDNSNRVFLGKELLGTSCLIDLMDENNVAVILNGYQENFKIDLSKGIYIGFDKKGKQLYLIQSKTPFEYD